MKVQFPTPRKQEVEDDVHEVRVLPLGLSGLKIDKEVLLLLEPVGVVHLCLLRRALLKLIRGFSSDMGVSISNVFFYRRCLLLNFLNRARLFH